MGLRNPGLTFVVFVQEQAESVINEMIDDVIVWFCAETHRSAALGYDHWTSDGE